MFFSIFFAQDCWRFCFLVSKVKKKRLSQNANNRSSKYNCTKNYIFATRKLITKQFVNWGLHTQWSTTYSTRIRPRNASLYAFKTNPQLRKYPPLRIWASASRWFAVFLFWGPMGSIDFLDIFCLFPQYVMLDQNPNCFLFRPDQLNSNAKNQIAFLIFFYFKAA